MFSAVERAHGIHGGDAETSLMLAFRPHTVRMNEARNFVSSAIAIEKEFRHLHLTQPIGFGWMSSDLNELAAAGDAANATAAKGEACADNASGRVPGSAARRARVRPRAPEAWPAC